MFRRAKQYTSGSYESYKYINSEKVVYGMGGGMGFGGNAIYI